MASSFRPSLRFSLRALLVTLTLVCCWLGWEINVVRTRAAKRKEAEAKGLSFVTVTEIAQRLHLSRDAINVVPKFRRVSIVRRWLGDEAIHSINYDPFFGESEADVTPYLRYFPEATSIEQLTHMSPASPVE